MRATKTSGSPNKMAKQGELFDGTPPPRRRRRRDRRIFDGAEGERQKSEGMRVAAQVRDTALTRARAIAEDYGRRHRYASMNDVGPLLAAHGITLGPASGSLFKYGRWRFTGDRVRSTLVVNHGREIYVWEYVGP